MISGEEFRHHRSVIMFRRKEATGEKWQTGSSTDKIIKQLKAEPKVILPLHINSTINNSVADYSSTRCDRNVPDLSDIANYVECTTFEEDVYVNEDVERRKAPPPNDIDAANIEVQLSKMFHVEDEIATPYQKPEVTKNKPRRSRKATKPESIRELLLQLFGSTLDDLDVTPPPAPKKLEKNGRRHTLPVSISIANEDFLMPLKVSHKRKSETDACAAAPCKVQRTEIKPAIAPRFLNVELGRGSDFIIPKRESDRATVVMVSDGLRTATVTDPPMVHEKDEIETVTRPSAFIDLTGDDGNYNFTTMTVKNEREAAPSMPLLSPIKTKETVHWGKAAQETSSQRPPLYTNSQQMARPPPPYTNVQQAAQPAPNVNLLQMAQPPPNVNLLQMAQPPPNVNLLQMTQQPPNVNLLQMTQPPPIVNLHQMAQRLTTKFITQQTVQQPPTTINNQQIAQGPPTAINTQQTARPTIQIQQLQATVGLEQMVSQLFKPVLPPTAKPVRHQPTQQRQTVSQHKTQPPSQTPSSQSSSVYPNMQSVQRQSQSSQGRPVQPRTSRQHQVQPQPTILSSTLNGYRAPKPVSNLNLPVCQAPEAPQLTRIFRHSQYEFHLVSNAECADKLYPHVNVFLKWRLNACRYCDELRTIMSGRVLNEDHEAFFVYANHSIRNFGMKLIKELSLVDVENFNITEVFSVLADKLQEKSGYGRLYRICMNIHLMVRQCEEHCTTPFTKKFYNTVKMCMQRMEAKSRQVALFSPSQLKLLEEQINKYLMIKNWTNMQLNRRSSGSAQTESSVVRPWNKQNECTITLRNILPQRVPEQSSQVSDNRNVGEQPQRIVVPEPVPSMQDKLDNVQSPNETSTETVAAAPTQERSHESVIVFNKEATNEDSAKTKDSDKDKSVDDVIDLTWIDDGDEAEMLEEITDCKSFPFKVENYPESDSGSSAREVVSPVDSGLGSPLAQGESSDSFKCLCGNRAIYVCTCNSSMYCSRNCQIEDWADHQKWCQEIKT